MTSIITRETAGGGATVKDAPLTNAEIDNNFISITTSKLEASNNLSDLTNISTAQANLGIDDIINSLGTMSEQDSDSVVITGGSVSGITDISVSDGGTGASTASDARNNLGLGSIATQDSSAVSISGGTVDNVTITGGSVSGITDISIADGGTGASTASDARNNLGLGSIATQDSSAVSITGGSVSGITLSSSTINNDISGNASTATTLETSRNIFGQPFDGSSSVSGNITFGTQASKATLSYTTNESVTLDVPNLSGNRTLAFINESQVFSGNQTFSNSTTFNSDVQINSLGVGTSATGTQGDIRATGDVIAHFSSDRRHKENIREIGDALQKVCSIGGKLFTWTDEYINSKGGDDDYFLSKEDFGVIAQDVKQVFPQAVKEKENGDLAVNYIKLCALAFSAIKELNDKIEKE